MRHRNWAVIAVFALASVASFSSRAQTFPARPMQVIIGFGAGGIADILTRIATDEMSKRLGQPIVVENRPGAAASVAAHAVRTAAPDGYTLYSGPTNSFSPIYLKENAIEAWKDLTPISFIASGDWFMYVPSTLPVTNLKELAAYAKANTLRFAAPSTGNTMLMAQISKRLGIKYENIPYKATDQTITSLLRGDTHVTLNARAAFVPFLQKGELRLIATLSPKRLDVTPDVPTAIEQGVDFEARSAISLWGPPGLPAAIVATLNSAAVQALKMPGVVEKFRNASFNAESSTPQELARKAQAEVQWQGEAAKLIGYEPQ